MISHNVRAFAFTVLGLAFGTYIVIFILTQDLSEPIPKIRRITEV